MFWGFIQMGILRELKEINDIKRAYGITAQEASLRLSELDSLVRLFLGLKGEKCDYYASNIDLAYRRRYEKPKVEPIVYHDAEGKKKLKCGSCGRGLRSNDNYCPFCGVDVVSSTKEESNEKE